MAESAFREFNARWPFRHDLDALQRDFDRTLGLASFPESACSNHTNNCPNDLPNRSNLVDDDIEISQQFFGQSDTMVNDTIDGTATRLASWIQKCRDQNMPVDIDRITRCAIYLIEYEVVDYLIENEYAKLEQKDALGRSALFYAVTLPCSDMLNYLADKMNPEAFKAEMNHRDSRKATPLHYAVKFASLATVEFCLAKGIRPDHAIQNEMANKYSLSWHSSSLANNHIALLFALYGRLEEYLHLPVYIEWLNKDSFHEKSCTIHEMQTDPECLAFVQYMTGGKPYREELKWIHIPWTNGVILFLALRIILRSFQSGRYPTIYSEQDSLVALDFLRRAFHDLPTVPGNPYLNYRLPMYESGKEELVCGASCEAIVFPVLVLQEKYRFKASRNTHTALRDSMGWDYAKKLIQAERTLDEASYTSLDRKALDSCNKNQVVSRECKKLLNGQILPQDSKPDPRPILMVRQFWIWKFDNHILSAYSNPGNNPKIWCENGTILKDIQLIDPAVWERSRNEQSHRNNQLHPHLHIGILLANLVDNFGKAQANGKFPSPLDIFELGVVQIMSRVDEYMNLTNAAELNLQKEIDLIHDIFDIKGELAMINEILLQQGQVLNHLIENADYEAGQAVQWKKVVRTKQQLTMYHERVAKIDRDVARIEKYVQDVLNLKRTHASIRDTRMSVVLGTAVIIFTLVTIIFTPLAFMTSLFALPIDKLVRNQSQIGDKNEDQGIMKVYGTGYVGKWFAATEIVTLFITGVAVYWSFRLSNLFGRALSDTAVALKKKPRKSEETDGKRTDSSSKPIKSRHFLSFRKRLKNTEKDTV